MTTSARGFACHVIALVTFTLSAGEARSSAWGRRKLYLAGLFPLDTRDGPSELGWGVLPAVSLAISHVNADADLIPGYELAMEWNDTKCDMAVGTKLFFDMMHDPPQKVMLFGDACSHVTAPIALSSKYWNIWQLSYADTNPTLSDRDNYPNFFRVVPSDSDYNLARLQLLRHFNWTRVGTVFQDASKGSSRYAYAHGKLTELLDSADIHRDTESFSSDPKTAIYNLKKKDARIIIGNFDAQMAQEVFCAAYDEQMYGHRYVWIIPGDYPEEWWRKSPPCKPSHLEQALQGHFGIDVLTLSTAGDVTISGLTAAQYERKYDQIRGAAYSKYHGYAYDGIWAVARSMDRIIRQKGGQFRLEDFRNRRLPQALNETNFIGVTGKVLFKDGDRIGSMVIKQFQGGSMLKVGEYNAHTDALTLDIENDVIWNGKGPPRDRSIQERQLYRVNMTIYAILCTVSGLGVVLALIFLAINIHFRRHRYIKMSSPNMNNLIIFGCLMTYTSVVLLGIDGEMYPVKHFYQLCAARMWVLCVGFTLAFGAMFSKTWRVHAIFTNIKLNKKVIKDYKLVLIVAVMLKVDGVVLTAWQLVDPLRRETTDLPPEIDPSGSDVEIIRYIEYCRSDHVTIWMSVIYVYKGLLLIFGCFLAWETRHVTIPALNDSKYIGMSVYNVVIICVTAVPISFIMNDKPDQAYLVISLLIMFCTTITLCLVFVPKLIELKRDPKGEEKRIRATLRKTTKREDSASSDIQQKIRRLAEENYRYRRILDSKKQKIQELLAQLGEEQCLPDGLTHSPAHRTLAVLKGDFNTAHNPNYRHTEGSDDECSISTSSNTNLWPLETNLRHYTHVTRNPKDRESSDVIELKEISRPLEDVYLGDDLLPDVNAPLINQSHSELVTPPSYEDVHNKDKNNRAPVSAVRTPSYQGLKFLNDIFSLKETAILSDSDQSEAGSTHSLPGLRMRDNGQCSADFSKSASPSCKSLSSATSRSIQEGPLPSASGRRPSRDLGDWRHMPRRERLLGAPRRAEPDPGRAPVKVAGRRDVRQAASGIIPRNGDVSRSEAGGCPALQSNLSHCDVVQYI